MTEAHNRYCHPEDEVTEEQFASRLWLKSALVEPYIVQERIVLPSEPYPSVVDGQVEIRDRMFDTAPFVAHGESAYDIHTSGGSSSTGVLAARTAPVTEGANA